MEELSGTEQKSKEYRESAEVREGELKTHVIVLETAGDRKGTTDDLVAEQTEWTYLRWISGEIQNAKGKVLKNGIVGRDFMFSAVDSTSKRADMHQPCVGGVAVAEGLDGKDISFMFHTRARAAGTEEFQKNLLAMLAGLKAQTKEGTRTVRLYGGMLESADRPAADASAAERENVAVLDAEDAGKYAQSIEEVGAAVHTVLGIDPVIASGPSIGYSQGQDAYLIGRDFKLVRLGADQGSTRASKIREALRSRATA